MARPLFGAAAASACGPVGGGGTGRKGAVQLLKRPGTQEVAALSAAVTTMAHRLEERAAYIESFAAQVSHEFKTPLTSIQGAVELLSEHGEDMKAEEKAKFLSIWPLIPFGKAGDAIARAGTRRHHGT